MSHQWVPRLLRVEDIKERAELQLRANGLNAKHVMDIERAMERGDVIPPIKVAKLGNALVVVDGFHRLAAARAQELGTIQAQVAPMDMMAARREARAANVDHGLKPSQKDKRRAFDSYIDDGEHLWPDGVLKSSRDIVRDLPGTCTHTTVMRWLRARGIEPNRDADIAQGSKWSGLYAGRSDEGDDLDDEFAEAAGPSGAESIEVEEDADGPLDAEYSEQLWIHLNAVEPLFFGLGERHKGLAVEAVRKLLERMVANEPPEAVEHVRFDI